MDLLLARKNFVISAGVRVTVADENFPMSGVRKTVEVTVLTLQEAGMTKPSTIEEIRKQFKELGYRPLTLEEAVTIRVDFRNQPDKMKVDHKMTWFLTLLSKENGKIFGFPEREYAFYIYRNSSRDKYGGGYGMHTEQTSGRRFNPTVYRFACVKE